jgi:predicted nucleotide-binding protein
MAMSGTPWNVQQARAVDRVRSALNVAASLIERLDLAEEPFSLPDASSELLPRPASRDSPAGVFIVHGRDEAVWESVARVLEKAGRQVVILHEQANRGRTLIEKFEQHAAEAGFAIILLTGDDVGGLSETDLHSRARQNVVFEMGFFYGLLGRDRVAVLFEPGVEKPSDIDGLVYIELDKAGAWKTALLNEL